MPYLLLTMKFILTYCLLLLVSCSLSATTYYVDAFGSNSNPGTQAQPWHSIQYGVDQLSPGDSLYVNNGTYFERVTFHNSGTPGNPIVLTGPGGQWPMLEGSPYSPNGREGMITVKDQSHIVIEHMEIVNYRTSNVNDTPVGILVEGHVEDLTIRNCTIFGVEQNAVTGIGGANAIGIYGTSPQGISDLKIIGCQIGNIKSLWSEVITLNGNVYDFEVADNYIENCDNIGIDFIGWEGECSACTDTVGTSVDRVRDGWVHDNGLFNIDTKDNPAYGGDRNAAGIYVDGGADIIIEGNRIRQCNFGIEVASEHYQKASERIIVRNNLIWDNHIIGISTGGYDAGTGPGGGSARNCFIVNNTLKENHSSTRPQDNFGGEITLANRNIENVYKNNLVVALSGYNRVDEWGSLNSGNAFGNNLYHGSGAGTAPGMVSSADPMVFSQNAFVLTTGSPAIDAGDNMSPATVGQFEYDGVTPRIMGGTIDIGAREFGVPTSSASPFPKAEISVFPNPGGDFRMLEVPEGIDVFEVEVFDLQGKQIPANWHSNPSGDVLMWFSGLSEGMYLVNVESSQGFSTIKMMVK